jgi:hypothetical protein
MNKYVHSGTILYKDGRRKTVQMKQAVNHYIDTDKNRWRFRDGSLAGSDKSYPRLLLDSVHIVPGATRPQSRRLTHTGRVIVSGQGGIGKATRLRETKLFWVTETGHKFNKVDGWSSKFENYRLLLPTVVEYSQKADQV